MKEPLLNEYNGFKVVKEVEKKGKSHSRRAKFICKKCKRMFEANVTNIMRASTSSCGCARYDSVTKHGDLKIDSKYKSLRNTWNNINQRCSNKKNPRYKDYGGRGISLCDEWKNNYLTFRDWSIKNGWEAGLQIDRIDNDGNYEPDNCKWVTNIENNQGEKKRNRVGKTGVKYITQHSKNGTYFGQKTVYGVYFSTKQCKTIEEAKKALNLILENA